MAVVAGIRIGEAVATIDFTTNASNVVTGITITSTLPVAVRAVINHPGSGYSFDSELVLTAPLTISIPNPRRFPNDDTAQVGFSTNVRTVAGSGGR